MRIATWNVERLTHKNDIEEIVSECRRINADILVLTENDERICLEYENCFHTPTPPPISVPYFALPVKYAPTEHRVSVFTNYKLIRTYPTFDRYSALCVELETEHGNLLVYGTVIGALGNRNVSYKADLEGQLADFNVLSNYSLCVAGDFNCSFCDNYYSVKTQRHRILDSFENNDMKLLTGEVAECIDHIAMSRKFIKNNSFFITEWNYDKKLSDHKGICVDF